MKIAYFLTDLGRTGGPLTIYNFCDGLLKKGHEVYVVTISKSLVWNARTFDESILVNNEQKALESGIIKRIQNFVSNRISDLTKTNFSKEETPSVKQMISNISKLLIENYRKLEIDCDILIASHPYTAEAVYYLGRKKKIVMHSQHFEELMFDEVGRSVISALNYLPFHHIVNCQWLQKMFKFNYEIASTIISPGIDNSVFSGIPDKSKFLGEKPIKVITYCDPTRKFKGFDQQIPILKQLSGLNRNLQIQVFGHDPKVETLSYTYLGWIPHQQLARHYSDAHLSINFSWYESFPLPPLEAMASGCSVAASQYGTEEYLIDNYSGIHFDPLDINESVKKLNNLINNPEQMLFFAVTGKKMSQKFRWSDQIEKLHLYLMSLPSPDKMDIDKIQKGSFDEFDKATI